MQESVLHGSTVTYATEYEKVHQFITHAEGVATVACVAATLTETDNNRLPSTHCTACMQHALSELHNRIGKGQRHGTDASNLRAGPGCVCHR